MALAPCASQVPSRSHTGGDALPLDIDPVTETASTGVPAWLRLSSTLGVSRDDRTRGRPVPAWLRLSSTVGGTASPTTVRYQGSDGPQPIMARQSLRPEPHERKQMERDKMLTRQGLRDRGWTDKLIRVFLGEPDDIRNPHYRCAAPMKLYSMRRAETAEQTEEFREEQTKAKRRQAAAYRAAETKRSATMAHAESVEFDIPALEMEDLISRACAHYNSRHRDQWMMATPKSDPEFLERIAVNYLRHVCTDYDWELRELRWRVGNDLACDTVRTRVLCAIAEAYPLLADECFRQGMCRVRP